MLHEWCYKRHVTNGEKEGISIAVISLLAGSWTPVAPDRTSGLSSPPRSCGPPWSFCSLPPPEIYYIRVSGMRLLYFTFSTLPPFPDGITMLLIFLRRSDEIHQNYLQTVFRKRKRKLKNVRDFENWFFLLTGACSSFSNAVSLVSLQIWTKGAGYKLEPSMVKSLP